MNNIVKKEISASEELNAMVKVFSTDAQKEDFDRYQEILNKVTFDQSLTGIRNFGIGEQLTIHRKLRHCLLHYDGKMHTLLEAENGVHVTNENIKLQDIKIRRFKKEIETKTDLKTKLELDEFDIEERESKIAKAELEIEKLRRGLIQQYKLIQDAKSQVEIYKEEINKLLPEVEESGLTFEQAEDQYWKARFLRDIEVSAKAKAIGCDQGVLQSISQLPQSSVEEIFREANKIPLQLQGGGIPYEFAYKRLETGGGAQMLAIGQSQVNDPTKPDIIIGCLKRSEEDVCVTDVHNMLVIPGELNQRTDYIWGHAADTGRNMVIQKAMEDDAKYVFFIDDDTLLPRNALAVLYDKLLWLQQNNPKACAIGGHYYKKTLPLESAHLVKTNGKTIPVRPEKYEEDAIIVCDGILASGCLLIDLEMCKKAGMTLPYFLELRATDGDMLATDDIHFTRKCQDFGLLPFLHLGVKCLHIDKQNKKVYGIRDEEVPYAVNDINMFLEDPTKEKKVAICVPFREGEGPEIMSTQFKDIYTPKGYDLVALLSRGKKVADARNYLIKEALKEDADYVFFIDDDVRIPGETLVELLKLDLDIVACPYPLKQPGYTEAILMMDNQNQIVPLDVWVKNQKFDSNVVPCNWTITMGCTLIKTDVFKGMREPWFQENYDDTKGKVYTEDAYFTKKAIMSGYQPYVHLGFPCIHIDRETGREYNKPGLKYETRIIAGDREVTDIIQ